MSGGARLSERFRPRMLALATAAGLLVATVPSAVHFALVRRDLGHVAARHAAAIAERARGLWEENPLLWRHDADKHAQAVAEGRPDDLRGVIVLDGARRVVHAEPAAGVIVWAEATARSGGRPVAIVRAGLDAGGALARTLALHAAFSALGAALALLLYRVPLRVIRAGERGLTTHAEVRARIARELHDGVGQSLTAARLQLQVGSPAAATAALDAAVDELRRVVAELRPADLEGGTLGDALRALAAEVGATGAVGVELALPEPMAPVPPVLELACYRIAQEALNNVVRHARARRAEIALTLRRDTLELVVADDGVGVRDSPRGAGLRGMNERAAELGGALDVAARPGGGTRVVARLPLARGGAG